MNELFIFIEATLSGHYLSNQMVHSIENGIAEQSSNFGEGSLGSLSLMLLKKTWIFSPQLWVK